MKKYRVGISLLAALSLSALSRPAFAEDTPLNAIWKDGLKFESADKAISIEVGGRIQADAAFFLSQDDELEEAVGSDNFDDDVEIRRARLHIAGKLYDQLEFKAEYDFAGGGEAQFKDVYLGLLKLPVVGGLRLGHMKEPFGLDQLTSSRHTTFMERSLPDAFSPAHNIGVMLHSAVLNEQMTYAVGVFKDTDEFGEGTGGGGYSETVRITGAPWYENDGESLLHLGLAYSHREATDDTLKFSQRPETHLAGKFVDTGAITADDSDQLGVEAAAVFGPFSVQGEYAQTFVNSDSADDPDFFGYYGQLSYFITGEHRVYKRSKGAFDAVTPTNSFIGKGETRGPGAWEAAIRYSAIDLSDGLVEGGELSDITVGLNWYLNTNLKWMLNYVYSDVEDLGNSNIVQTRLQVWF